MMAAQSMKGLGSSLHLAEAFWASGTLRGDGLTLDYNTPPL